jgi:hypothetical protein
MKMRNILGWGAAGLGMAAVVTGGLRLHEQNLEQPAYTVIERDGVFELRDYAPVLVAQTTVIGERRSARTEGFKRLAGYIFGNKHEKIAMTAPVFSDGENRTWRTRFVMPARFTAATLPPMPTSVTATQIPARRMAVIRFNGPGSEAQLAEQEARLRGWLTARGLHVAGNAVSAFYNSPMVPALLRRNEVMIMVE